MDSEISMKTPKCGGNFSTPRVVNEFVSEWIGVAIIDNKDLHEKPEREKSRREGARERERERERVHCNIWGLQ